jgi:hypothetical protein
MSLIAAFSCRRLALPGFASFQAPAEADPVALAVRSMSLICSSNREVHHVEIGAVLQDPTMTGSDGSQLGR